jgi:hypothetical protein
MLFIPLREGSMSSSLILRRLLAISSMLIGSFPAAGFSAAATGCINALELEMKSMAEMPIIKFLADIKSPA